MLAIGSGILLIVTLELWTDYLFCKPNYKKTIKKININPDLTFEPDLQFIPETL
ncbi:hypothetical protein [Mycoplasma sp. Ms02]|uniref:hypothetical protein n=1 Tax=Mycoplasma sp. Ms02 TaxID=353851 RepID=UPI001C8AEEE5|nr:hypothetical protein [Mycoplasma sp. Ms02]QZE12527.1 hypothetical protein K4L35_00865 [Mycoplasma sp. Ms02]